MKLGEGIRINRLKLNLTQDDLADQLFVSRQTISKWEQGNTYPDLSNLLRLTEYLMIVRLLIVCH
ncbi:MAG: helix-turn-helix transcriptional regulator [Erysipelothrix sp.]